MINPKHFGTIVHFFVSLVISIILSILLPLMAMGTVTATGFFKDLVISFLIAFILGMIFPIRKWGDSLAGVFKLKPDSFPAALVSTAVQTIIYATVLTLSMISINAGIGPHTIPAWLHVYPFALVIIYIISLICAPLGVMLARKLTSRNKDNKNKSFT